MREVPYGQDVLLENLADPAHVEYAHHAVFGGRDRQLVSRMSVVEPVQQESGCVVHVADTNQDVLPPDSPTTRKMEFRPPTLVRYAACCVSYATYLRCTVLMFELTLLFKACLPDPNDCFAFLYYKHALSSPNYLLTYSKLLWRALHAQPCAYMC